MFCPFTKGKFELESIGHRLKNALFCLFITEAFSELWCTYTPDLSFVPQAPALSNSAGSAALLSSHFQISKTLVGSLGPLCLFKGL